MLSITEGRLGHAAGILTSFKEEKSSLTENHLYAEFYSIPVRVTAIGVGTSEGKSDGEAMGSVAGMKQHEGLKPHVKQDEFQSGTRCWGCSAFCSTREKYTAYGISPWASNF